MVTTKKNQHHTRDQIWVFVRNVIVFKNMRTIISAHYIYWQRGNKNIWSTPLTSRAVYWVVRYLRNTHVILLSVTSFPWVVILTLEFQYSFNSFSLLSQLQKSPSSVFRSYDPNKRQEVIGLCTTSSLRAQLDRATYSAISSGAARRT